MANKNAIMGVGFLAATGAFVTIYSGLTGQSINDIILLRAHQSDDNATGGIPSSDNAMGFTPGIEACKAWCDSVSGKYPYAWGGGHLKIGQPSPGTSHEAGGPIVTGFDCSGAVSGALHAAGLLSIPLTSGMLMAWGEKGEGDITVYASPSHTFMNIQGQWFGTGKLGDGGGAAWGNHDDVTGYVARRPKGGSTDNAAKQNPWPLGLGRNDTLGTAG